MEYQKSTAWKTLYLHHGHHSNNENTSTSDTIPNATASNCQVYPISIASTVHGNKLKGLLKSWKSVYVISITRCTLLPSLWTLCRPLTVLYFPVP